MNWEAGEGRKEKEPSVDVQKTKALVTRQEARSKRPQI